MRLGEFTPPNFERYVVTPVNAVKNNCLWLTSLEGRLKRTDRIGYAGKNGGGSRTVVAGLEGPQSKRLAHFERPTGPF